MYLKYAASIKRHSSFPPPITATPHDTSTSTSGNSGVSGETDHTLGLDLHDQRVLGLMAEQSKLTTELNTRHSQCTTTHATLQFELEQQYVAKRFELKAAALKQTAGMAHRQIQVRVMEEDRRRGSAAAFLLKTMMDSEWSVDDIQEFLCV